MQPGDFVDVALDEEGHIVLASKKLVDASQAYFWTGEAIIMRNAGEHDKSLRRP